MYEYKAIPFLASVKSTDKESAGLASKQLEETINSSSSDGWEFYSLGAITVEVAPGCLGSLTGSKSTTVRLDQIIFRRSREVGRQVSSVPAQVAAPATTV